jgi:undecaprenyl diphosphate synthase
MSSIPDPELIIRTGAVNRMSNFLTFQSAYSELLFLDCMWPDMTEALFEQALQEFERRERRFGQ